MAEAIDDVRELREDRRIDVGDRVEHEGVDQRLDLAAELFENEMLVLHLGREAGCLEQPLAIPAERVGIGSEGDPGKTGGGIEFRLGDVDEQDRKSTRLNSSH